MKKGYFAIYALMALNVIITTVFIFFLPDEVPLHTGFSGEVDRFGSRYENYIMPALAIGIGIFLLLISKFGEKENEKVMVYTNIGIQLLMIAFAVFWFSSQLSFSSNDSGTIIDFAIPKVAAIGVGVLFIFLGNMMPKANINSTFGVRTSWSASSEEVWQKTQRFGGYACIVSGILMIVLGILTNGAFATISMFAITIICGIVCVAASYKIYKNHSE